MFLLRSVKIFSERVGVEFTRLQRNYPGWEPSNCASLPEPCAIIMSLRNVTKFATKPSSHLWWRVLADYRHMFKSGCVALLERGSSLCRLRVRLHIGDV